MDTSQWTQLENGGMLNYKESSTHDTTLTPNISQSNRKAKKGQNHQALNCPRCDSKNTKFCYYNNYSLTQPRYFCKTCKRYWTEGGTLRNIPIGGFSRKHYSKNITRGSSSSTSNAAVMNLDHNMIISPQNLLHFSSFHHDELMRPMMGSRPVFNTLYSSGGLQFQEVNNKPSYGFCYDQGISSSTGNGGLLFENFHGVVQGSEHERFLFPFQDLKQVDCTKRDENPIGYSNGMFGGAQQI